MDDTPPASSSSDNADEPVTSVATAKLRPSRVGVPPWIQLVGLPIILVALYLFASNATHAVMAFTIAALISLTLNPIIRSLHIRAHIPRSLAVLIVFVLFLAVVAILSFLLVNWLVSEVQYLQHHIPAYSKIAQKKVASLQHWLNHRKIHVNIKDQATNFLNQLQHKSSELGTRTLASARDFVSTVAETIFSIVLVMVITVYMLLDARRIGRGVASLPPRRLGLDQLGGRIEHSLARYVRGQILASAVMGISAMIGLWIIGAVVWPDAESLAPIFGAIVFVTEFAPTIGPVLGAIPPIIGALFHSFPAALVVLIFFVLLHQFEGHVVVPRLMGRAVGVPSLVVIFAVIAGAQLHGVAGILLALPLVAVGKQIVLFAIERLRLEGWPEGVPLGDPLLETQAVAAAAGLTPSDDVPGDTDAAADRSSVRVNRAWGRLRGASRMFSRRRSTRKHGDTPSPDDQQNEPTGNDDG